MRAVQAFIMCAAILGLGGCLQARSVGGGAPGTEPAPASPFAPNAMRVYPLTRVEKDAKGKRLLCFIEFQDAWADTTKATGTLHVALFRSLGLQSEMAQEAQTWDVDLSDLERNARLFDPATRTYRLALRDLPEWLDEQTPVLVRVSLYSGAAPLSAELRLNR